MLLFDLAIQFKKIMILNKINLNATYVFTFLTIINFQALLKAQDRYTKIQIGSQVMQNYNLGDLISFGYNFYMYEEKKERVATTVNQDFSLTRTFDQHHGLTLGGGLFNTCRWVDAQLNYDDLTSALYKNVKPCYKNYMLYFMYQYTSWLSSRWNAHISAGPMWARNYNMADWFYVPVKLNYFSIMIKFGLQYKISNRFSVELNGVIVRSMTNIVNLSDRVDGSLIPLSFGADLRIGYKW